MRRVQPVFLLPAALILTPLRAQQQQTFQNQNVTITYPATVTAVPGSPATFNVNVQLLAGSMDNVAGMTCSGPGNPSVSPQFISLAPGTLSVFGVTVQTFSGSTASEQCNVTTGIRGGSDDPPIDLNPITIQQASAVPTTAAFLFGQYINSGVVVFDVLSFPQGSQLKGPLSAAIQGGNCGVAPADNPTIPVPSVSLTSNFFVILCPVLGPNGEISTVTLNGTVTDGTNTNPFNLTQKLTITSPGTNGAIVNLSMKDPVSTATGELLAPTLPTFLSLGGPLPLEFRRYYASLLNNNQVATHTNNWTHNFESFLSILGPFAVVVLYDGKRVTFQQSGGAYKTVFPEQYDFQLVSGASNTYQFLDPRSNLIYTFSGAASGTGVQNLGFTKVQDRNGNTLTIAQGPNGPTSVTDGLGRSLTFTYDSNGNLIKVADQTGRAITFGYSSVPMGDYRDLLQITDANGKQWNYAYTSVTAFTNVVFAGLMNSATLPLGNIPFTQTWNNLRQVTSQSDSRGNTTTFTYDQPQGSASYTDPAGGTAGYTSAGYNAFLTYTDSDGQTVSATYDANQRRNSVTDRFGDKVSLTYDPASGKMATHTDEAGNVTSYTWTAQTAGGFTFHNLTQVNYGGGSSISLQYDAPGNLTSLTDQAGKVSKFAYNSRGQLTSETDPAGRVTSRAYNAADATLASITDAAGNVVKYSYDALKRINLITFADGSTRSYTYDNLDNVVKTADERSKVTTFAYNDNDKLQSATDALSQKATMAYSADEEISKATDRNGQSTSYAYDSNDLLNKVTTPAAETFTFNHDSHRRLSAALDPAGKGLQFAYDKEDVLASITDALSRKISFTSDHLGYRTKVTTPLGENYSITRDTLERVTSATDPSGIAATTSYEPRGLISKFAVGGLSSSFSFDDSGLLAGVTDANGNPWTYTYDSAGRLGSRADPLNRATQYSYDARNRVSKIQTPLGSVTLTRDAAGNVLRRLYSDGTDLNYTYDDDNRLTGGPGVVLAYDADGRITASNGLTIARDADGRIASITYAPGKIVKYAYNSVGLLASVTDWLNGVTSFAYDAAHELTSVKRANGLGTQYAYDLDGRIASIKEDAGSSIAIQRDGAGKILSETRSQPQTAMAAPGVLPLSYDAADQVSGFTYDAMGRVTADAARKYQWDLASRLTSYTGADGSLSASYDGFGLRTSVTSGGATQNFVWNYATGLPSLATVQNASGDQLYYISRPDGTLLYAIDATTGARRFYHFDENGSTVLLTDDSGTVTDSYGITPYGETVTRSGSTANPFTWLGQYGVMQEGATGLYYMRARYYDSATSRFLSPDPVRSVHPLKVNPYEYARANPVSFIDPKGTDELVSFFWGYFAVHFLFYSDEDEEYKPFDYEAGLHANIPENINEIQSQLQEEPVTIEADLQYDLEATTSPAVARQTVDCSQPTPQKTGGQPADPTKPIAAVPNLGAFDINAGVHSEGANSTDSQEEEADVAPEQTDTSDSNPPAVCVASLAPNGSQFITGGVIPPATIVFGQYVSIDIERVVLPPGTIFYPGGVGFINPKTGRGEYWSLSLIPIGKKPKIQIPPKAQRVYRFGYAFLNESGVWEYVSTGPTGLGASADVRP